MAHRETLSFGPFRFELETGLLTKFGLRIRLQPKPAMVLSCLLERHGEIVTRAELERRLWPDGTHVDYQTGIKVAVKKLRDVLGDDSEHPVFIQTVHGVGYRFVGTVESAVGPQPNAASAAEAVPQSPASLPIPIDGRTLWFGALVSVVAVLMPAFLVPRAARRPVNFQNRDWVVIAAFENRTGEKLLDGTMEFAVERALSQSRYVNVAPRDRINDALLLMRQPSSAVLTENLARQVAVRDGGIKAVLAGRVEKLGPKYLLTVRLVEPARGDTLAVFEKRATQIQLPDAAAYVSDELRRKLGERSEPSETVPLILEKVTTPSLAACQAFNAAMLQINKRRWSQAASLLKEAILEDPQFASAHIYAAHSYSNLKQEEKAAPHYEAAFQLAPGVSQRERLFILGSYYERFLKDDRRAMEAYDALVNLYPDDYWGMNNLLDTYMRLGMYPQYFELLNRLTAIRPKANQYFFKLEDLWSYYRFDRVDKTKARQIGNLLRRAPRIGQPADDDLDSRLDLGVSTEQWFTGDVTGAARELSRVSAAARTRGGDFYKRRIVLANLALGRLTQAKELCEFITEPRARIGCLLSVAYIGENPELGREQLSKLLRSGPSPLHAHEVSMFARFGQTAAARQWCNLAPPIFPDVNDWLLLAEGRFAEAEKHLKTQTVYRYWYLLYGFPLAIALEKQGKLREAIDKLDEVDLPHGNLCFNAMWPQYRAKLAELYRKVGRIDDAVKVENQLRHYLSEADPDFPVLAQLRATAR